LLMDGQVFVNEIVRNLRDWVMEYILRDKSVVPSNGTRRAVGYSRIDRP
jgi:hypothetical protein